MGISIESPQKLKIELPYRSTFLFLDVDPKETKHRFEMVYAPPMFIAALFRVTKIEKQPKCPLIDECIKKIW